MGSKGETRRAKKSRKPKQMGGGSTGLSKRIRDLRKHLRLNQAELAKRLGVAGNAVSLWERDQPPTLENLRALAALGAVTLDWLVEGRDTFEDRLKMLTDDDLEAMQTYISDRLENRQRLVEKLNLPTRKTK